MATHGVWCWLSWWSPWWGLRVRRWTRACGGWATERLLDLLVWLSLAALGVIAVVVIVPGLALYLALAILRERQQRRRGEMERWRRFETWQRSMGCDTERLWRPGTR